MDQEQKLQLARYLNLLLQRKKIIIFCLYLSVIGGLIFYIKTPKMYKSSALIMYERSTINPGTQSILDNQARAKEQIATLTQQVTSRSNLETLIKQHDLYPALRQNMPMGNVVDMMRRDHIQFERDLGDVFKVSFQGNTPDKVMLVTNALAARFIEENLIYREEKVVETSEYVEDELNMAKKGLDEKEGAMRDYKLKYYNEMPQQLQINISRLNSLHNQLQNTQNSIQDLDRTRILIQEQISVRKESLHQNTFPDHQLTLQTPAPPSLSALTESGSYPMVRSQEHALIQSKIDALLLRYTPNHPEVKRLQNRLDVLSTGSARQETTVPTANESTADENAASPIADLPSTDLTAKDAQLMQLELQLKEASFNIEKLKEEKIAITKEIEKYQQWINMAPVREAEWSALTRDYSQLSSHYERLVTRNLQADSAKSLERRQKGSQFKIVESAYYPEKPFNPDFMKIILISVGLGLGSGIGLAFLLETLDTSFKDANDIERYIDIGVLCSIPYIATDRERRMNRAKTTAWSCLFLSSTFGLTGSLIYLWTKGIIII